jgi:hypothetical protein
VDRILCAGLDLPELLERVVGERVLVDARDGAMRPV